MCLPLVMIAYICTTHSYMYVNRYVRIARYLLTYVHIHTQKMKLNVQKNVKGMYTCVYMFIRIYLTYIIVYKTQF